MILEEKIFKKIDIIDFETCWTVFRSIRCPYCSYSIAGTLEPFKPLDCIKCQNTRIIPITLTDLGLEEELDTDTLLFDKNPITRFNE